MATTALLVVDVQKGLLRDHPWQEELFVNTLSGLLAAFREQGREVLFVRHDDGPESEALAYGSPGWEIVEEAAPLPGEKIFDKRKNSAFLGTGLEAYLKKRNVDTLVIAGMQTEYCIDATVKSAFERGFRVVIPAGGVTTFDSSMLSAAELNRLFCYHIWKGRFADVLLPAELESEVLP